MNFGSKFGRCEKLETIFSNLSFEQKVFGKRLHNLVQKQKLIKQLNILFSISLLSPFESFLIFVLYFIFENDELGCLHVRLKIRVLKRNFLNFR